MATVTEKQILSCTGMGETIVDLERRFLDTNGVRVVVDAKVVDKDVRKLPRKERQTSAEILEADILKSWLTLTMPVKKVYKPSLIVQLVVQQSITHSVVATKSHQQASVQKLPVPTWRDNNSCYG